jgi:hypothetical protein
MSAVSEGPLPWSPTTPLGSRCRGTESWAGKITTSKQKAVRTGFFFLLPHNCFSSRHYVIGTAPRAFTLVVNTVLPIRELTGMWTFKEIAGGGHMAPLKNHASAAASGYPFDLHHKGIGL